MTFEEKWNHVARRLFVFFTREGVFNFSLLLLSPLGRVDFASNASKRRERFLFLKRLRAFILLALQTSIVLTSISFRQATSPRRRTPPLRQTSSATFAYAADAPLLSLCDIFPVSSGTFTRFIGDIYPFHRESLPRRGKQGMEICPFHRESLFQRGKQGMEIYPFYRESLPQT